VKHGHNDGQATRSVLGLVSFVVDYSSIDRAVEMAYSLSFFALLLLAPRSASPPPVHLDLHPRRAERMWWAAHLRYDYAQGVAPRV